VPLAVTFLAEFTSLTSFFLLLSVMPMLAKASALWNFAYCSMPRRCRTALMRELPTLTVCISLRSTKLDVATFKGKPIASHRRARRYGHGNMKERTGYSHGLIDGHPLTADSTGLLSAPVAGHLWTR
jgi:hypothetical protein